MLLKIDQSEAQLGMYIHRLEGSWFSHPFWKTKFVLDDPAQLELLRSSEIEAVIIDTDLGVAPALPQPAPRPAAAIARPHPAPARRMTATAAPPRASAALSREFGKARRTIERSQRAVSEIFLQARFGAGLKLAAVTPLVDDVSCRSRPIPTPFQGCCAARTRARTPIATRWRSAR